MKILVFYLIIINIFTFLLYGLDKWKAKHHRWRISESALLLAALVGGSVGALAGMYGFHHKTLHKKFTIGVPIFLFFLVVQIPADHQSHNSTLYRAFQERLYPIE